MAVRPSWDEYFMEIARVVAKRSTCVRRQVGAIIVLDKQILATGYNGAPTNIDHCTKETCLRTIYNVPSGQRHELCRAVHAEQNAIIQAAKHGTAINGATIYCTNYPCVVCAKMIINAGIRRVVYDNDYCDDFAKAILQKYLGIIVEHIKI